MPIPSIARFADELLDLFPLVMRKLWQHERNYVTQGKISLPQLAALNHLFIQTPCTMHALAEAIAAGESTATGVIDRLVALRMVSRTRAPRDRRVVHVGITARGRAVMRQIRRQRRASVIRTYGLLSGEERRRYLEMIRKLANNLDVAPPQRRARQS